MHRIRRHLTGALIVAAIWIASTAGLLAAEPPFAAGSWTLVALPDTQNYVMKYPDIFTSQTRWIVENRDSRNIVFVTHEGDITNNNKPEHWANAKQSMSVLDGVVPYALVTGNHDYGPNGSASTRDTLLEQYFPVSAYTSQPTFGGLYSRSRLDNSYHLFSAGGRNWILIALEWGPRECVVNWAGKVLQRYSHRTAIIVTHAYLRVDGTRQDHKVDNKGGNPHGYPTAELAEGVNDGEELWQKLVSRYPNVAFVLCGHTFSGSKPDGGAAVLTSEGIHGNRVHQILADYQGLPEGGQGYLRLMEFLPDGKTVEVKTYSPHLDQSLTGSKHQFTLDVPAAACAKSPAGTATGLQQ